MLIGAREVALTNLEKVFFPRHGLTKGDLVRYYLDLAPCVLNHVARGRRRPLRRDVAAHGLEPPAHPLG